MRSTWFFLLLISVVSSKISVRFQSILEPNLENGEYIYSNKSYFLLSSFYYDIYNNTITKFPHVDNSYNFVEVTEVRYDEIYYVDSFPNLEYLWMAQIEQRKIPVFTNVPRIRTINLASNNISEIEPKHFSETTVKVIYLDNNEINYIGAGSFGKNVTWVDLRCNKLVSISAEWFLNTQAVKRINLQANSIESIQENLFANFTSLNDLNLGHNRIISIGVGAFSGTADYEWLYLNNNQLTSLDDFIFLPNTTIGRLFVECNNLTFLSSLFLEQIKLTHYGFIHKNPWQCACYERVQQWLPKSYLEPYSFQFKYVTMVEENKVLPECVTKTSWKRNEDYCVESVDQKVIEVYSESLKPLDSYDPICPYNVRHFQNI